MKDTHSAFARAGKKLTVEGTSERVNRMAISPIKEMELLAHGRKDKLSLGQGTPSFQTPKHIQEAVVEAIRAGKCDKYMMAPGLPALREAIAEKLGRKNGIQVDADKEVLVTAGDNEAVTLALLALVNEGDEVVVPSPNYSPHLEQIDLVGGKTVFVPLIEEERWRLDVDGFRKAVNPKTKAIILNTPLNPTGSVFAEKDLRAIADIALENGAWVVTDETYEDFVFEGEHFSVGSIPELKEKSVNTFSFSKSYAMTGWRAGYVACEEGFLNQLLKIHDNFIICTPLTAQYAALAALQGPQDCVREFKDAFRRRRELVLKRMAELDGFSVQKPQGAYYAFPRVEGVKDSFAYCLDLMEKTGVVTVPGRAFGPTGEGHIRISYCMDEETINEAFDRIEKFVPR